jgi:hypothetical protein
MRHTFLVLIAVLYILALEGCSTTVPVKAKFPDLPEKLQVKCPNLEKVIDEAKLSDVAKTVNVNYSTYYECAVKHDAIVEWYQIQKRIFESVK